MKLYEEFKEYENLWEQKTALSESPGKAYRALMKAQTFIEETVGWEIVDCDQEDDYTMILKCDTPDDIDDDAEAIEDFCWELGVDASINLTDSYTNYDVIIYLTYEG